MGWKTDDHGNRDAGVLRRLSLLFMSALVLFVGSATSSLAQPHQRFRVIDYPGARDTFVYDLNDAGTIVGTYLDQFGAPHGFLFANERFTTIDFPGAVETWVRGINNAGDLVGVYAAAPNDGAYRGFRWTAGEWIDISIPGAFATIPHDIDGAHGHWLGWRYAGA